MILRLRTMAVRTNPNAERLLAWREIAITLIAGDFERYLFSSVMPRVTAKMLAEAMAWEEVHDGKARAFRTSARPSATLDEDFLWGSLLIACDRGDMEARPEKL